MADQLVLDLDLGPVWTGLCWAHCTHRSDRHSLIWMPPDYLQGRCVYCKKVFQFKSRYGKDERPPWLEMKKKEAP